MSDRPPMERGNGNGHGNGHGNGIGRGNGHGESDPLAPTPEGTETGHRLIVPGPAPYTNSHDEESEQQLVQDLGSASRSCVAIIVVLLFIALVVCVFLFWAFVIA